MTDFNKIDDYIHTNLDVSIAELTRLCAQPSVSAQNLGFDRMRGTGRRNARGARF
jgi:hypothetical protein